ncbi:MAG: 16S rRNA (guanine(527)-N(7))-methyltransferase RsmG [Candidatus Fonsibacter lacus]|nr:16S rRNA (guanine(527)-N(7))-methyltransferase RsmG [Candidatus Fonsibacter lacus]
MNLDVEFFNKKFNVSRETIEKLNKYKDFLLKSNKYLNLIGKTTENQIFKRHFADSAQIYDLIEDKSEIIDLGSGAGFPGILLRILMDDKKITGNITLIDKSFKKCKFLKELSDKLSLTLKIVNLKIENYKFDKISTVVSRAFKKTIDTIDIIYKNNDKIRNIILIKGKTYQQELEDAKKKYTFDVEKFRSITSDESYILKIYNIKYSTT